MRDPGIAELRLTRGAGEALRRHGGARRIGRLGGTRMTADRRETSAGLAVRWALPIATLAFFAATAEGYGVFRDELYYLACGRHLDWGYVDHPPMVALLAALAQGIFGDSLVGGTSSTTISNSTSAL